jgi:3'5'-cyclic nucleotide phosphodiesterase
MSVHKLLSRLIAPKSASTTPNDSTVSERDPTEAAYQQRQQQHYEQTYGISSDPLVQFAVVLAALIHDLDHAGVPNAQLMRENATLSERYQGRSVAEQNSLDLAWRTFTSTKFEALRQAIAPNEAELCRLRQILVHAIMATDIFDPEWSAMRTRRWQEAFATQETSGKSESEFDDNTCQQRHLNQKATIVVEHLIQASDVAHTMQHVRVCVSRAHVQRGPCKLQINISRLSLSLYFVVAYLPKVESASL